ncbi:MAG: JAB domain-containing protein [Flavobacteriales bacterium]|nr:JAB domain-containing protein [Flavobacteriales bacterium]
MEYQSNNSSDQNQENYLEKCNSLQEIKLSYKRSIKFEERFKIRESHDIHRYAKSIWNQDSLEFQESFYVLYLDRQNSVLGWINLAKGGLTQVCVDKKILLATALKVLCSSIIILHNHPSGNLKPSQADINLTNGLLSACNLLDIVLLDHVIISTEGFFSFADEGLI